MSKSPLLLAALIAAPAVAEPVEFTASPSIGATYDSNLFRLSRAEKRTTGLASVDDAVLVPQLLGQIAIPLGLQRLSFGGRVAYRLHAENTDLDSLDTGYAARLRYVLPIECGGLLQARQFRRLTDYDDVELGPRRIIVRDRLAAADIGCDLGAETRLTGAVEGRQRRNRDEALSRFDLEEFEARTALSAGLVETGQPFIAFRYRRREQDRFVSARTPDGVRATILDLGGGARWQPSPLVDLTAQANYTSLRETSRLRNAARFTGEARMLWELAGKTRVELAAVRSLDVSPNIGAIAFKATTFDVRFTWDATPRITARFDVRRRTRSILRDLLPTGPGPTLRDERDETWGVDARADYAITDALSARAGVGYRDRDANFADLKYKAAVATIGLSYRFAGPSLDVPLE